MALEHRSSINWHSYEGLREDADADMCELMLVQNSVSHMFMTMALNLHPLPTNYMNSHSCRRKLISSSLNCWQFCLAFPCHHIFLTHITYWSTWTASMLLPHVWHIKGTKIIWADLISHLLFDHFRSQFLICSINWFVPPAELLGESWRGSFWAAWGVENAGRDIGYQCLAGLGWQGSPSTTQCDLEIYLGYIMEAHDYLLFCISHGIPIDPTPQTLLWYIAYTSQYVASGLKYLTSVHHFLAKLYPDFDKTWSSLLLQSMILGMKRLQGDAVRQKLPLRLSHLQGFCDIVRETGDYDDLLFIVILSCCFYACHKLGELVVKNECALFNWGKIIKQASLHFSNGHAGYHLHYHKADCYFCGTDILHVTHNIANTVQLLCEYVTRWDAIYFSCCTLFIWEDSSHLTWSWFNSKFSLSSTEYMAVAHLMLVVPLIMLFWDHTSSWEMVITAGLVGLYTTIHAELHLATLHLAIQH